MLCRLHPPGRRHLGAAGLCRHVHLLHGHGHDGLFPGKCVLEERVEGKGVVQCFLAGLLVVLGRGGRDCVDVRAAPTSRAHHTSRDHELTPACRLSPSPCIRCSPQRIKRADCKRSTGEAAAAASPPFPCGCGKPSAGWSRATSPSCNASQAGVLPCGPSSQLQPSHQARFTLLVLWLLFPAFFPDPSRTQ